MGLQLVNITTSGVLNGNTSQTYAIKHPLAFISNKTSPWDWYTNTGNKNDNLWIPNTKSVFDPCPQGWRTPSKGTWSDYSITIAPYYIQGVEATSSNRMITNGRLYQNLSWYPALGARDRQSGLLVGVGANAYCWSSSVNNAYVYFQYFDFLQIIPDCPQGRGHGFPVRCVQE